MARATTMLLLAAFVLLSANRASAIQCNRFGSPPTGGINYVANLTSPGQAQYYVDPVTTYVVCASLTLKLTSSLAPTNTPFAVTMSGIPNATDLGYSTPPILVTNVATCEASLRDMLASWRNSTTPGLPSFIAALSGLTWEGTYSCCDTNLCNLPKALAASHVVASLPIMMLAMILSLTFMKM